MKVIDQYFTVDESQLTNDVMLKLERIARTCYKSEDQIAPGTADVLLEKLIKRGHEAMLEHAVITVCAITDRGVTHEIVRHRIASYAQESTRYCNYGNDKFGNEITVIKPVYWLDNQECFDHWIIAMHHAENGYLKLLEHGASAQEARAVLPNSLKTEIWITMNIREWRHFFSLRTSQAAHPQMRALVIPMEVKFIEKLPILFGVKNLN